MFCWIQLFGDSYLISPSLVARQSTDKLMVITRLVAQLLHAGFILQLLMWETYLLKSFCVIVVQVTVVRTPYNFLYFWTFPYISPIFFQKMPYIYPYIFPSDRLKPCISSSLIFIWVHFNSSSIYPFLRSLLHLSPLFLINIVDKDLQLNFSGHFV